MRGLPCNGLSSFRPSSSELKWSIFSHWKDESMSALLPSETSQSRCDTLHSHEQPPASQLLFVVGVCVSTPVRKNQRSFSVLEVSTCRWQIHLPQLFAKCWLREDKSLHANPKWNHYNQTASYFNANTIQIVMGLLKTNTCSASRTGKFKHWVWFKQLKCMQTMVRQWQSSSPGI